MLARIKEVWVGIEDPDPTVDRKGIKYLQDMGVMVSMFDRDLQDIIRAENKEFIAQALERAASAGEQKPQDITLSSLEETLREVQMDDLSTAALEAYRTAVQITDAVGSVAFQSHLVRSGILLRQSEGFVPTGFGYILFGKDPETALPQARLLGTIFLPDGTQDIRNFEGPQVFAPDEALQWLRDKLLNPIDRSHAQRREVNAVLYELVREGIVNALVHRDYNIAGGKCQLRVTPDKIEILSPGSPIPPITLEQMQSFRAPMLSRNPVLHSVFARMNLAEERGIGLASMQKRAEEAGLPLPRYTWNDPYLVLTLYRSIAAATHDLSSQLADSLDEEERRGFEFIVSKSSVGRMEYAQYMEFDARKAQRSLKRLIDLGLIQVQGAGPATRYVLTIS